MAYEFRLGEILLPVTPSKFEINVKGKNKVINLVNDGEINIIKQSGLKEISFTALLPNVKYPFAKYEGDGKNTFKYAQYFLDDIEKLKESKEPFQFSIIRRVERYKILFPSDYCVVIEDYTILEDSSLGSDVNLSIKLKEYKSYFTKDISDGVVINSRQTDNSPMPNENIVYTAKSGDCLWDIAKKYYNDGNKYIDIANYNNISNPNLISVGQKINIPVID